MGAKASTDYRGETYQADRKAIEMVNAAIYLRRPLLITGKPGAGKSSLAYAVARELQLGQVLRWNVTSRTTLREGLYHYDALARLNDYNMGRDRPIGDYIALGPLATALLPGSRPRVLLIDEIDKADIDLPNDLLNVFEEGSFEIPELAREQRGNGKTAEQAVRVISAEGNLVSLPGPRVECAEFPFVVLTSNGERDFPAPFLRRCVRLYLPTPDDKMLARIVEAHMRLDPSDERTEGLRAERQQLIAEFLERAKVGDLATDQLLNAVFIAIGPDAALNSPSPDGAIREEVRRRVIDALLRHLTAEPVPGQPLEAALIGLGARVSPGGVENC